ncbi:MAG: GtrA family protein [Minisyncoccia bacterium]
MLKIYYRLFKYLVSGGSAAVVNLGTLYVLTEFAHFHYLLSATLSFAAAFFVSFLLQKFWTFKNTQKEMMHWQMVGFLGVSLINLLLNTLLIYVFVEYFHVWYFAAAIVSGGLLAVSSFFVYKHIIFVEMEEGHVVQTLFVWMHRNSLVSLTLVALALAISLSTSHLLESPPTWLDEGIITQTAINISHDGPQIGLQTAPGHIVSAGYVSTSYPVTYPIAISFILFGVGLMQARIVMVLFVIGFVLAVYFFLKKEMTPWQALAGLFLIASFAPLYGNGKNVLGEVPGLFLLMLFLLWIKKIEMRETTSLDFMGASLVLGLAVVTKPIFLLLLPVVGIVFLFSLRLCTVQKVAAGIVGFAAPVWLWLVVQFNGETFRETFAIYANPHSNDLASSIVHNALGFIIQPQPFYAALLLGVWMLSFGIRLWTRQAISRAEYIAIGFAVLVYVAYLRGATYYRYFFLGEVFALMYLPRAIGALWPKKIPIYVLTILLSLLILFQTYQSFFASWVAEHYSSHRSQELNALVTELGTKSVFIYQAPEAVVFLPTRNYYQYLNILHVAIIGEENLALISNGVFDAVLISRESETQIDLSRYSLIRTRDRYSLWYKK